MPKLTVENMGDFEVPAGTRLVNALTDIVKIDQFHACGGHARCTTCRVQFEHGEPIKITEAEKNIMKDRGLAAQPGMRLSCQILCDHDMTIRVISRWKGTGAKDAGGRPADMIEPPPVWLEKAAGS
ncbi:MAG: 2Fe-2S iron-sulfur cluster-binding protein [Phycisphaerae bacterium]